MYHTSLVVNPASSGVEIVAMVASIARSWKEEWVKRKSEFEKGRKGEREHEGWCKKQVNFFKFVKWK